MKHVCYTCGLLLKRGIPGSEVFEHKESLEGTPFHDMSPYQFCGFCIVMAREFPSAFDNADHTLLQVNGKRVCACGFEFVDQNWVTINRLMHLHTAVAVYEKGDFNLLIQLLDQQV